MGPRTCFGTRAIAQKSARSHSQNIPIVQKRRIVWKKNAKKLFITVENDFIKGAVDL
jgi:hypothetical protein